MKYKRELLSSCMEAVYGYFTTAKIQQAASEALREIENIGTGESRVKKAMLQTLTADEFLANLSTAVKKDFPYEGEVIKTDIWKSDYPLRFKKKTLFGWVSLAVYNYHTFMDDPRYADKCVVTVGIITSDYNTNKNIKKDNCAEYNSFLEKIFVRTGASFMRSGELVGWYIVKCAEHDLYDELNVLFDEYLFRLSITHSDRLPSGYENILENLPVTGWHMMEDGFVFIESWKTDWTGGIPQHSPRICEQLCFRYPGVLGYRSLSR